MMDERGATGNALQGYWLVMVVVVQVVMVVADRGRDACAGATLSCLLCLVLLLAD